MRVKFHHPVVLGGNQFNAGEHEVDDKHNDEWFIKGLVKEGKAVVTQPPQLKSADHAKDGSHSKPAQPHGHTDVVDVNNQPKEQKVGQAHLDAIEEGSLPKDAEAIAKKRDDDAEAVQKSGGDPFKGDDQDDKDESKQGKRRKASH